MKADILFSETQWEERPLFNLLKLCLLLMPCFDNGKNQCEFWRLEILFSETQCVCVLQQKRSNKLIGRTGFKTNSKSVVFCFPLIINDIIWVVIKGEPGIEPMGPYIASVNPWSFYKHSWSENKCLFNSSKYNLTYIKLC